MQLEGGCRVSSGHRSVAQDAAAMDAVIHHNVLVGGGAQGHVVQTPYDVLVAKEGIPPLSSAELRGEVFHGLMGYIFADGPHPVDVVRRFYAALRGAEWPRLQEVPAVYYVELIDGAVGGIRSDVLAAGYTAIMGADGAGSYGAEVESLMARSGERIEHYRQFREGYYPLADLLAVMSEDGVSAEVFFHGLFGFFTKKGVDALSVLKMVYVVAKALKEDLIAGMSLESLAVLTGDGGRATVSSRIIREYNRFIESEEGKVMKAHFQKTASVCDKYAAAQMGNKNRVKRRGRGRRR